jgi:hypothetical protein
LSAAAVVLVVVVAASAATVGGLARNRVMRDRATGSLGPEAAAVAGGRAYHLNTAFLSWVKRHTDRDERFYVMPNGRYGDSATYQWTTYQLLPRLSAAEPAGADVLVFHGVDPDAVAWDRSAFEPPLRFARGFALAHRRARG